MSDVALTEMLCDWRGAGRTQGTPDVVGWYKANGDKMILGEKTRQKIEDMLGISGEK